MSPSPTSALEQTKKALEPESNISVLEKISILQTFNSTLNDQITIETSSQVLSVIPLGLFYANFSIEDDRLTSILCEVINKLLIPFTFDQITSDENKPFLTQGLGHFSPAIRYLSLSQVFKCLDSNEHVSAMVESDILPYVLATIAFNDIRTADKACELLFDASKEPAGQEAFFGPTCSAMLGQLLKVNGIISFRVYSLIIKVASISDDSFKKMTESDLLGEFVSQLESNDILLKLNAIELLNEIAATPAGVTFLEKANLLDNISTILDNPKDNEIDVSLVKCAVINFFGNLGENKAVDFKSVSDKYYILKRITVCLESSKEDIVTAAISAIGSIGSHFAGLTLVLKDEQLSHIFFENFESCVGPVKAVYFQNLSKLVSVRDEQGVENQEIEHLTLDVYNRIQGRPSTLTILVREAKQPEDRIRIAVFALMQAIAYHAWGIQIMAQSNEFMDYILNRSTEHTLQFQDWKYAIISTMVKAPNSVHVFGDHYPRLELYIKQGVSYQPFQSAVAVESS